MNMSMEEFSSKLAESFRQRNPQMEVEEQLMKKNNGCSYHGLLVKKEEANTGCVFVLDNLYQQFKEGNKSFGKIIEDLETEAENIREVELPEYMTNFNCEDFVKNLKLRLVNWKKNRELIMERGLIYWPVTCTDLVCLFSTDIPISEETIGSMLLTNDIYKDMISKDFTVEQMYNKCLDNIPENTVELTPMTVMLDRLYRKIFNTEMEPMPEGKVYEMYILTGKNYVYGAALILSEQCREAVKAVFGDYKMLVLPSSVREVILLPIPYEKSYTEYLRNMVGEINREQLEAEDILSDYIYLYDPKIGELSLLID